MKLTIEDMCGMWRAQLDHRCEFGETLEELLLRLAPDARQEDVWHTAEVLGGLLGAVAVPVQQEYVEDDLANWFLGALTATETE